MTPAPLHVVHTEASLGWGGQELRILSEAAGMIGRGHRVTLLCPEAARIHAEAPRHGVPVLALPLARKAPRGVIALRRWLAANRPDVINTHSSTDTWLAALACASLRQAPPLVRTRHISAPVARTRTTHWLYTQASAHVVTTGEALRQTLIADNGLDPDRVTSIPTGVDGARFFPADRALRQATLSRLGLDPARRHIGIVATLRSWKGHLYLLEALRQLPAEWQLVIVGDGPMREVIGARMIELGLADRVVLAGHQDAPEDWLRGLDLFCLPSYANEGVPQALMQAMSCGLPVVSTPVGAIAEIVEHELSGLLVPPRDAPALAGALRRLIDDAALAQRLGDEAHRVAVTRFGRERMLDRMEALFAAVAASRCR